MKRKTVLILFAAIAIIFSIMLIFVLPSGKEGESRICDQPLVLFSDWSADDNPTIHCVASDQLVNLGLKGETPKVSPNQKLIVYRRFEEKEETLFNNSWTLVVYDIQSSQETIITSGEGYVKYFWLDNSRLLAATWDSLPSLSGTDYPLYYMYTISGTLTKQEDWIEGNFITYLGEDDIFYFENSELGLFSLTDYHNSPSFTPVGLPSASWLNNIDISQNGHQIVYTRYCDTLEACLVVYNPQSGEEYEISQGGELTNPRISHNGRFLAFTVDGKYLSIYDMDTRKIVFEQLEHFSAEYLWLPDNSLIFLVSHHSETGELIRELFRYHTDSEELSQLTNTGTPKNIGVD